MLYFPAKFAVCPITTFRKPASVVPDDPMIVNQGSFYGRTFKLYGLIQGDVVVFSSTR